MKKTEKLGKKKKIKKNLIPLSNPKDSYRSKFYSLMGMSGPKKTPRTSKKKNPFSEENFVYINQEKIKKKGFLKNFKITGNLGEGATSVVKKITDSETQQSYALKFYKTKFPDAFEEARMLKELENEGIGKFIKLFKSNGKVKKNLKIFKKK